MSRGKQKPSEQCKLTHLGVRMTIAEKTQLERAAAAAGVTASDLARRGLAVILERSNVTPAPAQQ